MPSLDVAVTLKSECQRDRFRYSAPSILIPVRVASRTSNLHRFPAGVTPSVLPGRTIASPLLSSPGGPQGRAVVRGDHYGCEVAAPKGMPRRGT
jgi:hypothetical protein